MWRRGADLEGHVANFVETEQILEADGFLSSYVQVWKHLLRCSLARYELFCHEKARFSSFLSKILGGFLSMVVSGYLYLCFNLRPNLLALHQFGGHN